MQDTSTLIELGFRKMTSSKNDEYLFRGVNQKFIAKVITNNGPAYVALYHASSDSMKTGKKYRLPVRECYRDGSVADALQKYDLPEDCLYRNAFGTSIKKAQ